MKIDWTKVKEGFTTMDVLKEENKELREENERLNNIINELEKELDLNLPFKVVGVRHLKNKLQELKGSDKE